MPGVGSRKLSRLAGGGAGRVRGGGLKWEQDCCPESIFLICVYMRGDGARLEASSPRYVLASCLLSPETRDGVEVALVVADLPLDGGQLAGEAGERSEHPLLLALCGLLLLQPVLVHQGPPQSGRLLPRSSQFGRHLGDEQVLEGGQVLLRTGVLGRCSLLQVDRVLRLVRRGLQRLVLRRGAGEGESQEEGGGQHVDFGGRHAELCSVRRAGGSERERARERAEGTVRTEPPRVVGRRGVCFGRERDLALGCVRRKEVSTRAKQVAAEQQARREAWRPCKQLAGRRRRKLEPRPSFTPPLLAAGPPSPPPALTPLPSSSPSSPKLPPLC